MSEAKAKVKVCTLIVVGLGEKMKLRPTDFGAKPMVNGDKVKVLSELRDRIIKQYHPHLEIVEKEKEKVVAPLKNKTYEFVGKATKAPAKKEANKDTEGKKPEDPKNDEKKEDPKKENAKI